MEHTSAQSALTNVALAVLALAGAVPGTWATVAPRSFYDDFPGFGRQWVAADGPFNEHLVRDVGGFFLALAALAIAALVLRSGVSARLAALAWLVFSIPHTGYHLTHLEVYSALDKILNVVGLSAVVVLAALVALAPEQRRRSGDRAGPD